MRICGTMSEGYTKLFSSIIHSTIWQESKDTKILWVTMLAMANKRGEVMASVPGLAKAAGLTIAETQAYIVQLTSADEFSRTKDYDGRRIEEIDGGWKILNHAKYREKMSADQERERKKKWDQENRPKRIKSDESSDVFRHDPTNPTHTEAEADTDPIEEPAAPSSIGSKTDEDEAVKFTQWFITLLPHGVDISDGTRKSWAATYNELLRLDGKTKAEIVAVCKWARSHDFWSANFLSPAKLRKKKDGITYFDAFTTKMIHEKNRPQTNRGNGRFGNRNDHTANASGHDDFAGVGQLPS